MYVRCVWPFFWKNWPKIIVSDTFRERSQGIIDSRPGWTQSVWTILIFIFFLITKTPDPLPLIPVSSQHNLLMYLFVQLILASLQYIHSLCRTNKLFFLNFDQTCKMADSNAWTSRELPRLKWWEGASTSTTGQERSGIDKTFMYVVWQLVPWHIEARLPKVVPTTTTKISFFLHILPPYTLAGFDFITHGSSLLGGRRRRYH
jgi:hypothetical protein